MKHSEVLNRYVNTGSQIPEKQYNQLSPSLKKSYMRMREIVGYQGWEFYFLTDDKRIKYIESKSGKIWDEIEVYSLLYYSEDKELIKKLLLQNGVDYKLINDMLLMFNIDIPLIPDNYQSMLNEIRRIKQIMG